MVFDLRLHGFSNCVIAADLTDISNNLPSWDKIPLTTMKLTAGKQIEHFVKPLVDVSGQHFLPAYEWNKKVDSGTYGEIFLANRKVYHRDKVDASGIAQFKPLVGDLGEQIVIKKTPIVLTTQEEKMTGNVKEHIINEEILAHIYEAAVLTLAYNAVSQAGFEHAVPRVYEIFCHSKAGSVQSGKITDIQDICISMEYILGDTLLRYMRHTFKRNTVQTNDKLFLHFLKQMANIIHILQTRLRMNHRDIKINNILLRDKTTALPLIVLIDYGFACIANGIQTPQAEMSNIEAGSYFGSRYACFKHGRDMVQFLYSLHCHFPLDEYLSPLLMTIVRPWLKVTYKHGVADLLNGLSVHGRHNDTRAQNIVFDEGIYIFLRRPEVDPIHCGPQNILKDIEVFLQTHPQFDLS
jgi:hypothetical protein